MPYKKFNYKQVKAIEYENKKKLLSLNDKLNDNSGIYFLTRTDENNIKYGYVGQAKHILTRLAQHLVGKQQHIDLSLKKHKLYSDENIYGWNVDFINCGESELDELEKKYILEYANNGYQLRNKTAGGQGQGKSQIDEYKPRKGYRDGVNQGKKQLAKEISNIIDKHLIVTVRKDNISDNKALAKLFVLLKEETYNGE